MSEAELIFTALAELSTRQIAERQRATGMAENKGAARAGGRIARQSRRRSPRCAPQAGVWPLSACPLAAVPTIGALEEHRPPARILSLVTSPGFSCSHWSITFSAAS